MGNERRHILHHREHKHNLQRELLGKFFHQLTQHLACSSIQTDEGVIHNQDARRGKQRLGELKLAQLAAGEEDNLLIQQRFQTEETEETVTHLIVGVPSKEFTHQRDIILLRLVPTLLIVVIGICRTVGITKSNILDVIVGHGAGRRAEVVCGESLQEGKLAS